ncbi:isochorismate synthase MenF [Chryseomicrobium palamuruense]|uniref:isochorismate synthase n=1 Tax=Chryseomicrobium palamuruense TaxID=682973 RepID=A0ABV8UWZ7_9BACL
MSELVGSKQGTLHLYTETIECEGISPLALYEAGEKLYKGQRFFWQNREKTRTIVGIGHARIIRAEGSRRVDDVREEWNELKNNIIKEQADQAPILFGGFSFDETGVSSEEWDAFSPGLFVVPVFQLEIVNESSQLSINCVTPQIDYSKRFDHLRKERDRLLHIAQVQERPLFEKPVVIEKIERNVPEYLQAVRSVKRNITQGRVDKVVISRSIELDFEDTVSSGSALYYALQEQPESYTFVFENESDTFFGATPERLIRKEAGKIFSAGVAGSVRRGKDLGEDQRLGQALLSDEKNREEHAYVVSMIQEVISPLCTSLEVPKHPKLLKIRDIQHLFTPIHGEANASADLLSFVSALHPTPALGGTPRKEAVELIRELEQMDRGYYAAPIGFVDADDNGEFVVGIRSALLKGGKALLYAGGGIVSESDPLAELEETNVKFRPMLRVLGGHRHEL